MAFDIADEAQGQVIVLDVDPPGTRQTTSKQGKGKRCVARNFEGGEKSRHRCLPESKSCPSESSIPAKGKVFVAYEQQKDPKVETGFGMTTCLKQQLMTAS
jgi:hypothetical protein